MSKKIFVLRAHSLVAKKNITLRFDSDNTIVIPFYVLDELKDIAKEYSEKGKNAKELLKYISSFKGRDLLSDSGVKQKNGSILRLVKPDPSIEIPLKDLKPVDLKCLQIAKKLQKENPNVPVILVSQNTGLRINADSIGIEAQDFKDEVFPPLCEQYTGRIECYTSDIELQDFFNWGKMSITEIYDFDRIEWFPNLFLVIMTGSGRSALGRYNGEYIVKLNHINEHPYGITPKNSGQRMMLEALMEDYEKAPLVIIKGGAGTGKTYQSLAVALQKTTEESIYSQILVSSPVQTIGQERIGFLPGDIDEKFAPHLGGIKDNVRLLINNRKYPDPKDKTPSKYRENGEFFFETGKIQVQPIGFLRGRTIVDTIFIIDETQNISPDDIKSIVSRAGQGSKFIFLGDPTQIDNPILNEQFNGLVYLSEKMKGDPLAWQITLSDDESVRSVLAKTAAKKL